MPRRRLHLLTALALCLTTTVCLTVAPSAGAETYGEFARISKVGKGTFAPTEETAVFGLDPLAGAPGALYAAEERGEETGEFRLQKLTEAGEALGEAKFAAQCVAGLGRACKENENTLEGPAFDTVNGERRIYLLAGVEREGVAVDSGKIAAGTLYSFSPTVKEVGKEKVLTPTPGTSEGVLANFKTLEAESETTGAALLEPTGIAVDPLNHDVIVAGWANEGEGANESEGPHLALQEITEAGDLGARYVDPTRETIGTQYNSPVVTPGGQILMQSENSQIVQIPTSFSSTEKPTVVFSLSFTDLEFGAGSEHGARLAIEPEGETKGRLYAGAEVLLSGAATDNDAVLTLSYEVAGGQVSVKEVGWIGGADLPKEGPIQCALGFFDFEPLVSAGRLGEKKIFVLEPGRAESPAVVEFAPGASTSGCPTAPASEPVITIEGHTQNSVHTAVNVGISSQISNANALHTIWEFGDGSPSDTVTTPQEEEAFVEHDYVRAGELELKGTIETDDLADPLVNVSRKVKVEPTAPTARFTGSTVAEGESTSFNGEASTDPNSEALEYEWKFGDGTAVLKSASAKVEHKYAKAGGYPVTLTVKDTGGNVSTPVEHRVTVKEVTKGPPTTTTATTTIPTSTTPTTTTTIPTTTTPTAKVEAFAPVTLAGTAVAVSKSGTISLKLKCPVEESCAGTLTLQTANAVVASAKKRVLTLAGGSFVASAGQTKSVTLHLSSTAMKLLRKANALKVRVTIAAHNGAGVKHTTVELITLRPAKR